MQDLQVSSNEVVRVLPRCKINNRLTAHHLLEGAGMISVNRMSAAAILIWRSGAQLVATLLRRRSRPQSAVHQLWGHARSRTEGKLEVGTPSTCFMHHGVKLWNTTSRAVKDAKTK
jgi:hypothetical protein